ncbi:thioesterase family protein [Bdellovibrio sp. KM01]|uniref:acyl-CoA thioesterase n=1 Tax=Bdellovibrio sp. KM01 TaxID=2748865 RepID=UPI0015EA0191|nr:acyl-CoA thioesterase [Bdellovibrio sp. KM01]QLY26131.1 acyl-CoA thioesterase [Bdellovibrio sp. KM01]
MSEFGNYKILIRETHIDSYGHVNNATYLSLYEEARWEAITPRGFGFSDIHRLQQGPVILEVSIKFLKEIKLRESITIVSSIMDYEGKIGHMKQQMIKHDGTVASEAVFTFGLFDLKARKMILPTPEWKKACGLE